MVLYAGRPAEIGPARRLFEAPAHPYTASLHLYLQSALNKLSAHQTVGQNTPAGVAVQERLGGILPDARANIRLLGIR
jgi:peptide/nickel transport system ATP-binding protein